ncbi:NAD(P)H-dependent oxidoreductase [Rhizobacter sp. SG703]|uniref:FMN-dependent NADH-azoreductase n=1 Tax=Rhizobacter sp. SG703 TaxID=2587140 RepID=UPI001444A316|nr:NAD(P)H-dependent oxidoreductase [Rhizobacter sp. SG703]NKI97124.1 FMN-dependent NADH-azoreductase [Rhizobacter sp. SG703]
MNILRISCSPRGASSESQRLSQKIVDRLVAQAPAANVVERSIGDGSLAHVDANYALAQHAAAAEVSSLGSMATSDVLIRELERSDAIVIATPMHNLGVPSVLKAWLDHVVRARRTFHVTAAGKVGALRDRPVYLAIASGGRFSGEQARQPDFLTPHLKAILGTIGLHDVRLFSVEGTGAGAEAVEAARARADQALAAHFAIARVERVPDAT